MEFDLGFIVRLKENRHVTYKGEIMSPKDLATRFKGKYAFTLQDKHGKTIPRKLTDVPVTLHAFGVWRSDWFSLLESISCVCYCLMLPVYEFNAFGEMG